MEGIAAGAFVGECGADPTNSTTHRGVDEFDASPHARISARAALAFAP